MICFHKNSTALTLLVGLQEGYMAKTITTSSFWEALQCKQMSSTKQQR